MIAKHLPGKIFRKRLRPLFDSKIKPGAGHGHNKLIAFLFFIIPLYLYTFIPFSSSGQYHGGSGDGHAMHKGPFTYMVDLASAGPSVTLLVGDTLYMNLNSTASKAITVSWGNTEWNIYSLVPGGNTFCHKYTGTVQLVNSLLVNGKKLMVYNMINSPYLVSVVDLVDVIGWSAWIKPIH